VQYSTVQMFRPLVVRCFLVGQVRDVLGNGQVFKKRLVDGEGEFPVDCPLEDCVVRVHYRGSLPEEGGACLLTREGERGAPVEVGTGEGLVSSKWGPCVCRGSFEPQCRMLKAVPSLPCASDPRLFSC